MSRNLGVCSWSLQPDGADDLTEKLSATGLGAVQLALEPLRRGEWDREDCQAQLAQAGKGILSGMVETIGEDYSTLEAIKITGGLRPDGTWDANRAAALEYARIARDMGIKLVSFHAGFLPEDPEHPEHDKLLHRLREFVDIFATQGLACALETGQESATALAAFLTELNHPTLGINFDPANMILYDKGDPVPALKLLAPFVRQIHIKDARRTSTPGTWGEEVPVGEGDVDWEAFFNALTEEDLQVDLVIEREAGEERVRDIIRARNLIERQLQRLASH